MIVKDDFSRTPFRVPASIDSRSGKYNGCELLEEKRKILDARTAKLKQC